MLFIISVFSFTQNITEECVEKFCIGGTFHFYSNDLANKKLKLNSENMKQIRIDINNRVLSPHPQQRDPLLRYDKNLVDEDVPSDKRLMRVVSKYEINLLLIFF